MKDYSHPEIPEKKKTKPGEPDHGPGAPVPEKPVLGPLERSGSSIFSKPGPVSLEASKARTLTLGNIRGGSGRPDQVSPYQAMQTPTPPSPPSPPPVEHKTMSEPTVFQTSPVVGERSAQAAMSMSPLIHNIDHTAVIDPRAVVTGNVVIGPRVYIAPGAIIHGGNDEPIYIGEQAYIQEGVVIRDLPSRAADGRVDTKRLVEVDGKEYSVYIGKRAVVCAQAQIHGPAKLEDGVYIGMQSLVFWAGVGKGTVVEPRSVVMNVSVPGNVFVPTGLNALSQKTVNELPPLTPQYRFHGIGEEMVESGQERRKAFDRNA